MSGTAETVRGLVLVLWTYGLMGAMGLALAPVAALGPRLWTRRIVRFYCRIILASARLICGLGSEIRGEVPRGAVIVAAKHQSFLDIIMLVSVLERPRFVMKRSLLWAPVLGFYARRIGCIAIDRSKGREAMREMLEAKAAERELDGQLVIYPQGTRVAPGVTAPWRPGVAVLYDAAEEPCVPVATNAGVFWPRKGVARRPGTAVVEFLPPIPAGLGGAALLARLRDEVEAASGALLEEARRAGRAP
ncbi:MAG: lysophospholipid acyltransferase family protein [Paracoccaceae bacterium]